MSKLGKIWGVFKHLGRALVATFHIIEKIVTPEVFDAALTYARAALDAYTDNSARRAYVIQKLHERFPVLPEYVIRLALEMAVTHIKHAEDKLEDILDGDDEDENPARGPVPVPDPALGPTLEEYVATGYKAENYPPQGYAIRESPGLDAYRAQQAEAAQVPAGDGPMGEPSDPALDPSRD